MKKDQEIQALIEKFEGTSQIIAEQAMYDLAYIGTEAVPNLLNCLKNPNTNIRYYSANTLIYIGDEKAVDPILEMLATEEKIDIIYEISAVIPSKFSNLDIDLLLKHLTDENWKQRYIASIILGHEREKRAVDGLIKLLNDPSDDVRWAAADSLGRIKDFRAVDSLLGLLEDQNWNIRYIAINGLGKIGHTSAVPYLNKVSQTDQDQRNRNIAREAIIVINDKDSPLRKSVRWWNEPGNPWP